MKYQRILVYHIGSLGDTLVTVPALWVVRENFPNAKITMLTDQNQGRVLVKANDVLDGSGLIDDYIAYPAGKFLSMLRLLFELRFRKFDALVYLIRAYEDDKRIGRDKLFFRLAGIKQFLGMKGFNKSSITAEPHVADTLLVRLQADGLRTPSVGQGRIDVKIGDSERENVKQWLSQLPSDGGRSWLAIGPGAKMPCNIWPFEKYLEVAKQIVCEYDLWPVVFGGASEMGLGQRLVQELGRGYVPAGKLSVRDSMAAMERCILFVGNDTGTMHMAAASGVRCVAPFSSRNVKGRWYPYGKGHIVFQTIIDCQGCGLEECIDRKMECILSISVQQVVEGCRSILSKINLRNLQFPGQASILIKLQAVELDILKTCIHICEKHNIRYFLLGGSALGAVRHSGFIPWDDDIDIGMPRPDYQRFLSIAQAEFGMDLFLQTFETDSDYPLNFAKVRNSKTTVLQSRFSHINMNHGAYIDIFPLDGISSNEILVKFNELFFRLYRACIQHKLGMKHKSFLIRFFIGLYSASFSLLKLRDEIEEIMKKYDYEASNKVINWCGSWGLKELVPKDYFGKGHRVDFEDTTVIIPEDYDSYLKSLYGNYMTPPQVKKRVSTHIIDIIDLENPYTKYKGNNQ